MKWSAMTKMKMMNAAAVVSSYWNYRGRPSWKCQPNNPNAAAFASAAAAPSQHNQTIEVVERSRDLEAYNPNVQWKVLQPSATPCIKPERPQNLRGPTVPEDKQEFRKFNFSETWDRPPVTAMSKVVKIRAWGNPLKGKKGRLFMKRKWEKKEEQTSIGCEHMDLPNLVLRMNGLNLCCPF